MWTMRLQGINEAWILKFSHALLKLDGWKLTIHIKFKAVIVSSHFLSEVVF